MADNRKKHASFLKNVSKFKDFARRYGLKRAVKKGISRITGTDTYETVLSVPEPKCDLSKYGVYAGGVKNRVSIVLPVYNQAEYLPDAVEGVLAQTYADIELIIVNDGSTDGTGKILERYQSNPRVVIVTQENRKLPAALNTGFARATGEFFTWTSADNIMLPEQIGRLVKFKKENPSAAMVFSDYEAIDDNGSALNDPLFRPRNQQAGTPHIIRLPELVSYKNLHESGDNFIGPSFLYDKTAALITGAYSTDTFGGEDYDYWLRLNCLFSIKHLPEVLYKYRVHAKSLTSRARELDLDGNIRRLLKRDAQRRRFYGKNFRIINAGVLAGQTGRKNTGKNLLLFRYSLRTCEDVRRHFGSSGTASICVISGKDAGSGNLDSRLLAECDWAVTDNRSLYEPLRVACGGRALVLRSPETASELFTAMADSRLFERMRT